MTLSGELIRKLKGDVYYSLPKSHLSPREKARKFLRHFTFVEGIRHENIAQANDLFEKLPFEKKVADFNVAFVVIRNPYDYICLLYTSPSPRDKRQSRMPSSA